MFNKINLTNIFIITLSLNINVFYMEPLRRLLNKKYEVI